MKLSWLIRTYREKDIKRHKAREKAPSMDVKHQVILWQIVSKGGIQSRDGWFISLRRYAFFVSSLGHQEAERENDFLPAKFSTYTAAQARM